MESSLVRLSKLKNFKINFLESVKRPLSIGQAEVVRSPSGVRQAGVGQESVRQESVRQESVRQESVRPESVKQESVRQESLRQESLRQESVGGLSGIHQESVRSW